MFLLGSGLHFNGCVKKIILKEPRLLLCSSGLVWRPHLPEAQRGSEPVHPSHHEFCKTDFYILLLHILLQCCSLLSSRVKIELVAFFPDPRVPAWRLYYSQEDASSQVFLLHDARSLHFIRGSQPAGNWNGSCKNTYLKYVYIIYIHIYIYIPPQLLCQKVKNIT